MRTLNRYTVALVLSALLWAALLFCARPSHAQEAEAVAYTPLAVARQAGATGLKVQFLADAGCICRAESRVPDPGEACNGALCTGARLRAVNNVADAIDGGVLDR